MTAEATGADEAARLEALLALDLLDTPREERFDRVVRLAQKIFDVPMVAVNLIDEDRQWAKATIGLPREMPRQESFCQHTVLQPGAMVVPDALDDARFHDNPLVTGNPGIRFYAGQPLTAPGGQRVGALCIIDDKPRDLTEAELRLLRDLGEWVEKELALDQELLQAGEVQRLMLPRSAPVIPGYDVAGRCIPARQVGGDFFDWFPVDDQHQFVLGDVMGKGVAAALVAAGARAVVRGASRFNEVDVAVTRAAASMEPDLFEIGSFVTLFCARLDPPTGTVDYVDAGHGLTGVITHDGETHQLRSEGLPVGALSGDEWHRETLVLAPGSSLISVSDGFLDCFAQPQDAVELVATAHRECGTAQEVVDRICEYALRHPSGDDVTVLALRRLP